MSEKDIKIIHFNEPAFMICNSNPLGPKKCSIRKSITFRKSFFYNQTNALNFRNFSDPLRMKRFRANIKTVSILGHEFRGFLLLENVEVVGNE